MVSPSTYAHAYKAYKGGSRKRWSEQGLQVRIPSIPPLIKSGPARRRLAELRQASDKPHRFRPRRGCTMIQTCMDPAAGLPLDFQPVQLVQRKLKMRALLQVEAEASTDSNLLFKATARLGLRRAVPGACIIRDMSSELPSHWLFQGTRCVAEPACMRECTHPRNWEKNVHGNDGGHEDTLPCPDVHRAYYVPRSTAVG